MAVRLLHRGLLAVGSGDRLRLLWEARPSMAGVGDWEEGIYAQTGVTHPHTVPPSPPQPSSGHQGVWQAPGKVSHPIAAKDRWHPVPSASKGRALEERFQPFPSLAQPTSKLDVQ